MKTRKQVLLLLAVASLVISGGWFGWKISSSARGWGPRYQQWKNIATYLIGVESRTLRESEPEVQARFWLKQVAAVENIDKDAKLAMGAAWILDAPHTGFVQRYLQRKKSPSFIDLPLGFQLELDEQAIHKAQEKFEILCRDECLKHIETATLLDSGNVEAWRSHAMLLFQYNLWGFELQPRQKEWLSVLEQCAKHDPGNALYDYLAALQFWSSSAKYDFDAELDGYTLTISNHKNFERGNARFKAGLSKPFYQAGTAGYASAISFLKQTSVPRADYVSIAGNLQIDNRSTYLLSMIMRWQGVKRDVDERRGNIAAAVDACRDIMQVSKQITQTGNHPFGVFTKRILHRWSLANLDSLDENNSELFSDNESQNIAEQLYQAQIDVEILEEVTRQLKQTPVNKHKDGYLYFLLAPATFSLLLAQMFIVALMPFAIFFAISALVFRTKNNSEAPVRMGWLPLVIAAIIGIAISFLLWGLFPAKIVSPASQTTILHCIIWLAFAIPVVGLLVSIKKCFQLPWSLVIVLVVNMATLIALIQYPALISKLVIEALSQSPVVVVIIFLLAFFWGCWYSYRKLIAFAQSDALTLRRKIVAFGILILSIILTFWAATVLASIITNYFGVQPWISPIVWEEAKRLGITSSQLQNDINLQNANWTYAVLQWLAYKGVFLSLLISTGIILLWYFIRIARQIPGGWIAVMKSHKRNYLRHISAIIATSTTITLFLCLLFYLSATPLTMGDLDREYEATYQRLVDPAVLWKEIDETTGRIEANDLLMAKLKEKVDEYNREIAERERWNKENSINDSQ